MRAAGTEVTQAGGLELLEEADISSFPAGRDSKNRPDPTASGLARCPQPSARLMSPARRRSPRATGCSTAAGHDHWLYADTLLPVIQKIHLDPSLYVDEARS